MYGKHGVEKKTRNKMEIAKKEEEDEQNVQTFIQRLRRPDSICVVKLLRDGPLPLRELYALKL